MFSPSLKYTLETPLPARLWRGLIDVWQEMSISPLKLAEGEQRKIIQRVSCWNWLCHLFFFICLKRFLIFFFWTLKSNHCRRSQTRDICILTRRERSVFSYFFSSKFDRQTVNLFSRFISLYYELLIINDDRFVIKNYFLNQ